MFPLWDLPGLMNLVMEIALIIMTVTVCHTQWPLVMASDGYPLASMPSMAGLNGPNEVCSLCTPAGSFVPFTLQYLCFPFLTPL